MKLSKAQIALLLEVKDKPQFVVKAYTPGRKLVELGLVSEDEQDGDYGSVLSITEAGRAALAD